MQQKMVRGEERYLVVVILCFLLCGFFWGKPTWLSVNQYIDKHYPSVTHIEVDELKLRLETNPLVLIDVREPNEFEISHLPGAVNVTELSQMSWEKDMEIVVYCSVGVRSAAFAEKLTAAGYLKVDNLKGSIFGWANRGYPLKRGLENAFGVHPFNDKWGSLLDAKYHQYNTN